MKKLSQSFSSLNAIKSNVNKAMVHTFFNCFTEELGFVKSNEDTVFARAGPSGNPIATPSICLYITSLKLNSTPVCSDFREFDKDFPWKRKCRQVAVIKSIGTDPDVFREWNIGKKAKRSGHRLM